MRSERSKKPPPPLQDKAPKEIYAVLTETLACFLPGRAKDLPAPLYVCMWHTYTFVENLKARVFYTRLRDNHIKYEVYQNSM